MEHCAANKLKIMWRTQVQILEVEQQTDSAHYCSCKTVSSFARRLERENIEDENSSNGFGERTYTEMSEILKFYNFGRELILEVVQFYNKRDRIVSSKTIWELQAHRSGRYLRT